MKPTEDLLEASGAEDAVAAFGLDPGGAWSRPRQLARVFRRLGMDVPQRLRTARFQEALQRLAQLGLEMRLADDGDGAPLPLDATSPGMHVHVRLRVAQAGGQYIEELDEDDEELDEAEEEQEEGSEDERDGDDQGDIDDDVDEEDEDAEDVVAAFGLDPGGAWSRPRQLSQVFRRLGMDVPQRLRTARFQEALQRLAQLGLEMRLVDGEGDAPLPLDATSPGMHVRVRLRVVQAGGPRRQGTNDLERVMARCAPSSPPPSIVVLPEAPRPAPLPRAQHREPAHEMALIRLQFLTAVPCMDRQHDPAWPDEYLAAATAGLEVTEHERRHLRMLAASFVRGHHSPSPVIMRLIKSETPHDLDKLVEWLRHLNRGAAENAEEIVRWVHEKRGSHPQPEHTPSPVHAPPPAHAPAAYAASPSPARPPRATTVEAPRPAPATPKQGPEEAPANVRSLGALDDMFKN